MRSKAFAIQSIGVFLFVAVALGQTGVNLSLKEVLTISSEVMTVNNIENKAIFETNVVILKGDLKITADRVEILLESDFRLDSGADGNSGFLAGPSVNESVISQLRATGNVTVQHGTRRAESQEALYNQAEEKITLLGTPVLYEKGFRITGSKMVFDLKENKSTVEESQVFFQPVEENESVPGAKP